MAAINPREFKRPGTVEYVLAAAMLADRSYEEVAAHWPDLDEARMRSPRQLCDLLEAVTDTDWRLSGCRHPQPTVREFVPLGGRWPCGSSMLLIGPVSVNGSWSTGRSSTTRANPPLIP